MYILYIYISIMSVRISNFNEIRKNHENLQIILS